MRDIIQSLLHILTFILTESKSKSDLNIKNQKTTELAPYLDLGDGIAHPCDHQHDLELGVDGGVQMWDLTDLLVDHVDGGSISPSQKGSRSSCGGVTAMEIVVAIEPAVMSRDQSCRDLNGGGDPTRRRRGPGLPIWYRLQSRRFEAHRCV